mmetsp:Transcript_87245/g.157147  ORF Transcript_87245/g.157147 Transcript_87245/m.157147 type:complete len:128 (+) Transcript_87245:1477-1860(+)
MPTVHCNPCAIAGDLLRTGIFAGTGPSGSCGTAWLGHIAPAQCWPGRRAEDELKPISAMSCSSMPHSLTHVEIGFETIILCEGPVEPKNVRRLFFCTPTCKRRQSLETGVQHPAPLDARLAPRDTGL